LIAIGTTSESELTALGVVASALNMKAAVGTSIAIAKRGSQRLG